MLFRIGGTWHLTDMEASPASEGLETRKENDMRKYLGYGILAVAASTVAVTAAHAFSYWWYVASYGYGG